MNERNERKYIIDTNLCKSRIAKSILIDCLIGAKYGIGKKEFKNSIILINEWINKLEQLQNKLNDGSNNIS